MRLKPKKMVATWVAGGDRKHNEKNHGYKGKKNKILNTQ